MEICPVNTTISLFGDPFDENLCVPDCPDNTFAEPFTRMCVEKCTEVPQYFGYVPFKQCQPECPEGYWADNHTQECVTNCSTGGSVETYADNSTNRCVTECPS